MSEGSDKRGYDKQLRELHKLYGKCAPAAEAFVASGPHLAICLCGRILKHPGQQVWTWDATISHDPGWVPITHADKKKIRASLKYTYMVKGLRNALQKRAC